MSLSTHVLDIARGRPAEGVPVRLERRTGGDRTGGGWTELAGTRTDADGRAELGGRDDSLAAGVYRITFATGAYHQRHGIDGFYPEASVVFRLTEPDEHYHVPLLLAPWGYSTYRGS